MVAPRLTVIVRRQVVADITSIAEALCQVARVDVAPRPAVLPRVDALTYGTVVALLLLALRSAIQGMLRGGGMSVDARSATGGGSGTVVRHRAAAAHRVCIAPVRADCRTATKSGRQEEEEEKALHDRLNRFGRVAP